MSIKKLKIQDNYTNANADILNAKLKGIGLRIKFLCDKEGIPDVIEDVIMPLHINGYTIYDTPLNRPMYNKLFSLFNRYLKENSIIESYAGQKEEMAWNYTFNLPEVKSLNISNDIQDILLKTTSSNLSDGVDKSHNGQFNRLEVITDMNIIIDKKSFSENNSLTCIPTDDDIVNPSDIDIQCDTDDQEYDESEDDS